MEQDKILNVEIVTPQRVIFEGKAASVSVPGTKAPFQILFNHAPIVSTLEIGLTKIVDESDKAHIFATGSGFTEVHKNKISILVESAFPAEEINVEAVTEQLNNAKALLKAEKTSELAKLAILEAENKLKAVEKMK
jgi:F-type H+-transporting ATPase subunit epsilon